MQSNWLNLMYLRVCVYEIYIYTYIICIISHILNIWEYIYKYSYLISLYLHMSYVHIYIYVFIISSVFNSSKFFCTDWTDDVVVCAAELGYVILLWLRDAFYLFILYIMVFGYPHTSHWIIFIWVEMGYNVEFFQLTSLY